MGSSALILVSMDIERNLYGEGTRRRMPPAGSIHDVEGFQNSPVFYDFARFAVDDHNMKQNSLLEFKKLTNVRGVQEVDKREGKVVAGHIYYMTVEVADCGQRKVCRAEILYQPWLNVRKVLEFGELPN